MKKLRNWGNTECGICLEILGFYVSDLVKLAEKVGVSVCHVPRGKQHLQLTSGQGGRQSQLTYSLEPCKVREGHKNEMK